MFAFPFIVAAQDLGNVTSFAEQLQSLVDILIPIVVALALLFFFWGLATFILAAGNEEKRKEGKKMMIWAVVALFIMAAVWGIIQLLANIFGVETGGTIETPRIN